MIPDTVFVDCETTGLLAKDELIEIAAIRMHGEKLFKIAGCSFKIRPTRPVPPEVAAINGYSVEAWSNAESLEDAMRGISGLMDGARLAGFNPAFDAGFIERACASCALPFPKLFSHRYIDINSMAEPFIQCGLMERAGLDAVCAFFDIQVNRKPHRALHDAEAAMEAYKAILRELRPHMSGLAKVKSLGAAPIPSKPAVA